MAYQIRIDKKACQGHARCANRAADLFVLDSNGYIAGEGFEVPPGREMDALNGAVSCPERVITLVDPGGQPVSNRNVLRSQLEKGGK